MIYLPVEINHQELIMFILNEKKSKFSMAMQITLFNNENYIIKIERLYVDFFWYVGVAK